MPTNPFARRALLCATTVLVCSTLAACSGDDGNAGSNRGAMAPTAPSPTPPPPPQYTETPVPFNLTQSRTFDILGWDSWASAPTPSATQFRWNAATGNYEVLAPGYAEWSRLDALLPRSGGTPYQYDVFGSGGTKLPFYMSVSAPPHVYPVDGYVGEALIWEGSSASVKFAFGIATQPGDVPVTGTMTCGVGHEEGVNGWLTFDRAAGTVSGWAESSLFGRVRYELVQTSFAPGATTFAATFGIDGVLEGRFFGPRAVNVAVRAKGGGQGSAAVTGIMTGACGG